MFLDVELHAVYNKIMLGLTSILFSCQYCYFSQHANCGVQQKDQKELNIVVKFKKMGTIKKRVKKQIIGKGLESPNIVRTLVITVQ